MIVLQIIGWILLVLLGLPLLMLLLMGFVKLSVRAGYCETPLLIVGLGPFKLNLTDKPEEEQPPNKVKKKKAPMQKEAKPPKKKEKPQKPPKIAEKPYLTEIVTAFKDLVFGMLSRFSRHLKIEELRLRVLVASDDAAKTALQYGSVCAATGAVRAVAEGARRVDKQKVHVEVECDFLAETPEIDAELCVSVRIWRLYVIALFAAKPLTEAIQLLKAYRYYKTKGSTNNGNTHETTD